MKLTQDDLDMRVLMRRAEFQRFLLHVCKSAGIWIPTAGAEQTLAYREGQRSLGLELIRHAARGLPRGTTEQVLAIVLAESTPKETDDEADPQDDPDERR